MKPPPGFVEMCKGAANIIKWENVPHDWSFETYDDEGKKLGDDSDCCEYSDAGNVFPIIPNCCEGNGVDVENGGGKRYATKDWWYWDSDWRQRIADGDMKSEGLGNGACRTSWRALGSPMTFCDPRPVNQGGDGDACPGGTEDTTTEAKCRRACAFKYTTEGAVRERCNYFSYSEADRTCVLFSECGWPLNEATNFNVNGNIVDASSMATHRVVNIYPAGFKPFDLREFNEPPVCIWVPQSGDKKVEVMIETEMNDASVCIRDGSDLGMGRNGDVGNVETCNEGRLEACFTAASNPRCEQYELAECDAVTGCRQDGAKCQEDPSELDRPDFFFMIYCEGSCEATDIDLWLRIRTSRIDWNAGKKTTQDDIEMWCEKEKGSTSEYMIGDSKTEKITREDYTWPSDLLPENPDTDPFDITHIYRRSSANNLRTTMACIVSLLTIIYRM